MTGKLDEREIQVQEALGLIPEGAICSWGFSMPIYIRRKGVWMIHDGGHTPAMPQNDITARYLKERFYGTRGEDLR